MTLLSGEFVADPCLAAGVSATAAAPCADAALYLRHVEGGESIRALAREAGCHASTILRRIRRQEARRDDPLVDAAMTRGEIARGLPPGRVDEARRVLRRLAESGAELALAQGMEKAIVTRDGIRTAIVDAALAEHFAMEGWIAVTAAGRLLRYRITSAGRDLLRALLGGRPVPMPRPDDLAGAEPVGGMAEDAAPFRAAQMGTRRIIDPETNAPRRARVNLAESPLLILARRREADGSRYLSAGMIAAAERLREDFELAQLGPRVTQNWERFMTAGIDAGRSLGGPGGGGSDSARDRVARALRELGPGMGDLVLRVCCFLEGIEATERRLGWAARSGKVVMRLALMRLERHYIDAYGPGSPMIG